MNFFDNVRKWFNNYFTSQPLYQSAQSYASSSNFILAPLLLFVALPIIAILGICGCIFGGRGSYSEPSYSVNTGPSWGSSIFNTPSSYSTMSSRMPAQMPTVTPSYGPSYGRVTDPVCGPTTTSSYGSSYSDPVCGPTTTTSNVFSGSSGQTAVMGF